MRSPAVLSLALVAACGARTSLSLPDDASTADRAAPDIAVTDVVDAPDAPPPDDRPALPDVVTPPDVVPPRDAPVVIDDRPRPMSVCGNGILEAGEGCDLGAQNRLVPAFQVTQPGYDPTALRPVVRRTSIAAFYGYSSASAHTGFEVARTANVLVYANALDGALGFAFFAGVDGDAQPAGDMRVTFTGMPESSAIAVSDDEGELTRGGPTWFSGRWNFQNNTDGGAFTNLPWATPWRVVIRGEYREGVSTLRVVDGRDGAFARTLPTEFVLEHFTRATACRPDCQEPRCGDGFLDAGERCDDGNRVDGDGCGADCTRLQ